MTFVIFLTAFLAAALALFSGFGLGTILTAVFLFFYDVKTAVFLVALVHLLNNLLKLFLFRKHVQLDILKRFGILAIVGSFIGAFGQAYVASEPLQKLIGLVLIYLGLQEWFPSRLQFRLPKAIDPIGGFFSGLLGGLVGNQGAIRSAFLLNYPISKEAFVATGVVIACLIDGVRIPVYWISYSHLLSETGGVLLGLVASAYVGTLVGAALLKRFSIVQFRKVVATLIVVMGVYFLF